MDTLNTDYLSNENLKSNYQTHSSVARNKTNKKTSKKKLISETANGFFWMGFNCLKARAASRR